MTARTIIASRRSWRYATAFAFAALLCGVLLGGVSAWFLGSVAIAGLSASSAMVFNFHAPAALVRLFAVGRTAARYGERLVGHKAALIDQVAHRVQLFAGMAAAPAIRRAGWQFGDQSRLADYLDDVEDVDYARLRAGLPGLTLACGLAVCGIATAFLAPLALLPIALLLLLGAHAGRRAATAGAMAWERVRTTRRGGARLLGAAMASVIPLKAEAAFDAEADGALASYRKADAQNLSLRRLQSGLDALGAAFGPVACLSVIAAAWIAGARGEMLLMPVFVAFAWLALGEGMNGVSRLLIADLRRRAAEATITSGLGDPAAQPGDRAKGRIAIVEIGHTSLQRITPDGRPIGKPIDFEAHAGRPTLLAGVSGSGKTSLLKQIAGWIDEDTFSFEGGTLTAAERREASTLSLHDAAILDDTVRANLFAPEASDDSLWQALQAVELVDRVRQGGELDGWLRQDMLSLGEAQRLNLARAWLSDRPIVLLDEPTEHLDAEQGDRILKRLTDHLQSRIVIISSHRDVALSEISRIDLR